MGTRVRVRARAPRGEVAWSVETRGWSCPGPGSRMSVRGTGAHSRDCDLKTLKFDKISYLHVGGLILSVTLFSDLCTFRHQSVFPLKKIFLVFYSEFLDCQQQVLSLHSCY